MASLIYVAKEGQVAELVRFLEREPVSGLFLLGLLSRGLESVPGQFYVAPGDRTPGRRGGSVAALAYLGDGGLLVPEGDDAAGLEQLAVGLFRSWRRVRVVVGPRSSADLLWGQWWRPGIDLRPRLWRDHLLFRMDAADLQPGPEEPGLFRAAPPDLDELVEASAAMRLEELGDDVLRTNPLGFHQRVAERIRSGVSWIVRDERGIAFKVDVGTYCRHGAQLEGVYTRPDRRGAGLATRSLRRLCRLLLKEVPRVTLHVWEENHPAVACYRRLGFVLQAPYRVVLR